MQKNMKESSQFTKILILGESEVGKTSIFWRFTDNKFPTKYEIKFVFDFKTKESNLNGKQLKLKIYDLVGAKRYSKASLTQNCKDQKELLLFSTLLIDNLLKKFLIG